LGAGRRVSQYAERFKQDDAILGKRRHECFTAGELVKEFKGYHLIKNRYGYLLLRGDKVIGTFKVALLKPDGRVLFELNKGMVLELSDMGLREVFTKEKAGLHGFLASDGGIYISQKHHVYKIYLTSKSHELIDMFNNYFTKVYKHEPHQYMFERKDTGRRYLRSEISNKLAYYDLMDYGAKTAPYEFKVPIKYLDKEGAGEWLKCFF
jgi:hypothetical protein